jgi:hypothetical protein
MGGEAFVDRIRLAAALPVVVVFAAALSAFAACGGGPSAAHEVSAPAPSPPASSTPAVLPPIPARTTTTASPSPPGFSENYAVFCGGRPTADQVVALLRRTANLLPGGARVTVKTGPLCAGTWQYTVVDVPEREPLQVISRGAPTALVLVTAGTDVCNVTVRTSAPAGILSVAHCV